MMPSHATDLYNKVLTGIERLNTSNVVLPDRAGKKPFAHYLSYNAADLCRFDDSADHSMLSGYSSHTYLEIVIGVCGRAELALAGQRFALADGDVAIVPPGASHLERILSRRQSYHLLWLNIKPDRLLIHSSMYNHADRFQVVRCAALSRCAVISRCFESAAEEAQAGGPYWMNLVRARLAEGWVLTMRTIETQGSGLNAAQVHRSRIDEAKAFLQAHFSEDLSLDQIAGKVFLSPTYFSSLFSQNEDKTVIEYLNELRIAEARRLLAGTTLSSKQIARRVGIPSLSYFCRLFRRQTGCSAQEYRVQTTRKHHKIGQ